MQILKRKKFSFSVRYALLMRQRKQLILKDEIVFLSPHCRLCEEDLKNNSIPQVDHIIALVDGGSNEIQNLQILCKKCHELKTKIENVQRYRRKKMRKKRKLQNLNE